MTKQVVTKKVVEGDVRENEVRMTLYEFLRAGLAWRDARRVMFNPTADHRDLDRYREACNALEKAVDAIQPPASKVQAPLTLEEALEASVAAVGERKVRRG